ncbi:GlxA family transcriptional regulator [Streptomyces sp. NBC_01304]|uniref:GlxA family transcriptional regulator n=1 Tax=Streptomyces sp. NBC_01304 TaxID=2903818 RepID=UPI002E12AFDC|nr:helix-turn-helix domain-containing protein [Streptomyces sp. NBC_01304]
MFRQTDPASRAVALIAVVVGFGAWWTSFDLAPRQTSAATTLWMLVHLPLTVGVSSGLDLCLHLIRRDHGPRMANQQARLLVAAPHPTGGQAPFIDLPVRPEPSDSPALYDWALRNLHQPLTVDQLARRAGMSRRTLIRRFHTDTGLPPMRWLLEARLARARELLESGDLTIEAVVRRCGLGTPANFRTLFKAHVGVAPRTYRETFNSAAVNSR